jgi:hypothetical protein
MILPVFVRLACTNWHGRACKRLALCNFATSRAESMISGGFGPAKLPIRMIYTAAWRSISLQILLRLVNTGRAGFFLAARAMQMGRDIVVARPMFDGAGESILHELKHLGRSGRSVHQRDARYGELFCEQFATRWFFWLEWSRADAPHYIIESPLRSRAPKIQPKSIHARHVILTRRKFISSPDLFPLRAGDKPKRPRSPRSDHTPISDRCFRFLNGYFCWNRSP